MSQPSLACRLCGGSLPDAASAQRLCVPCANTSPFPDAPLDLDFCHWLAGWTDARARFALRRKGTGYRWAYITHAAPEERAALAHLRRGLGRGALSDGRRPSLMISDPDGIEILLVVFEHCPLRSPLRAAQLEVWQAAFEYDRRQRRHDAAYHAAMQAYQAELGRKNAARTPPRAPPLSRQRSLFD